MLMIFSKEHDLWENIPIDNSVEASAEFVELFKKIVPSLNFMQKQAEEF
jgi:hypothetical protein